MPVEAKKQLYIGKSLSDLNKQVEKSVDKKNTRKLGLTASKILSAADDAYKSLDEERAFILYMRYVFIWRVVRQSNEYKKNTKYYDDLFGNKNIKKALDHAAKLSDSLETRYSDVQEEKELKEKLSKEAEDETVNGEKEESVVNGTEEDKITEGKRLGTNGWLKTKDLYDSIRGKDFSVIVMDIRSSDQYSTSQIKDVPSVNVPLEIIKAGATVITIQKDLPKDSKKEWNQRGQYDYVVLMDWDSSANNSKPGSPLASLKDAIYKWDSSQTLKHEPLFLEGGYTDWILRYPMYSTNSRVTKPPSYDSLVKQKGSLDFDYPDLDDKPTPPPPENKRENAVPTVAPEAISPGQYPPKSTPAVNRTLKPQADNIQPSAISGNAAKVKNQNQPSSGISTTVATVPPSKVKESTHSSTTKQLNGDAHVDQIKPSMPAVDRSSKPHGINIKEKLTDNAESKYEEIKSAVSPKTEKQHEQQEAAEMAEKEELEKLRKKEEEVRRQLDKMRMEKTRLENNELKKENQALEEKIRQHQEEMSRLTVEMEAHKARLHSKSRTEKATVKDSNSTSAVKTTPPDLQKPTKPQPSHQALNSSHETHSMDRSKIINGSKTTATLPAGWEMKWSDKHQRYFYMDHQSNTSHWEAPGNVTGQSQPKGNKATKPAVAKEQTKPDSLKLAGPAVSTSPERKSQGTTKIPLKSESSHSPGQTTLKRSYSSPNIAKMVADEEQSRKTPLFDRGKKPSNRPNPPQTYQQQQQLVVRKRNLDAVYGSQARALTGLRNLGNTCFMNSVVQCLSNTTLLSKYFIEDSYLRDINQQNPLGRKGEVAVEFAVVVKALWAGQYKSIAPRDLLRTVIKYVPEFNQKIGHHHDSQEFLVFLMDGLHEDVNQVKQRQYIKEEDFSNLSPLQGSKKSWDNHLILNKSIIVDLFQGQFRSVVRCLVCRNESVKYEAFMFLELPIPSRTKCTLQECLQKFQSEEKLAGDNATLCSKCKRLRDSVKFIRIWKLPPILIIHLKRFYFEGMWRQKLQTNVDFPVTFLDMRKFAEGSFQSGKGIYDLYAVSNHTGTLDGGHYTAFCKNAVNQRWYKYDDTDVYEYSVGKIRSPGAYILFYTSLPLSEP